MLPPGNKASTPPGSSGRYLRIAPRRGEGAGVDPPIPVCHWLRDDPGRNAVNSPALPSGLLMPDKARHKEWQVLAGGNDMI